MTYAYRYFPASPLRLQVPAPSGRTSRRGAAMRRLILAALILGMVGLAFWGGAKTLAASDVVTEMIEDRIQQKSGLLVEVRAVTPGLHGVELHGLRLVHEERNIELWADVVRIDADVRTLRDPDGKDLPAQLEGVRVTLPGGQVFAARRMMAARRADGMVSSEGTGAFEGTGGELQWKVVVDRDVAEPRGQLRFESFPVGVLGDGILGDALTVLPAGLRLDDAMLNGEIRFEPASAEARARPDESADDELAFAGRLEIEGLVVESERLAEQPLRDLTLAFDGGGVASRSARSVKLERTTMIVNGAETQIEGALSKADNRLRADLAMALPQISCDRAFAAIPAELLGEYQDFDLAGVITARLDLAIDTRNPDATRFDVKVDDQCTFQSVPERASLARFGRPFSLRVFDSKGTPMLFETGPGTPAWVEFEHISPYMVQAVMAHEDATFPEHKGFAVFAIEDSLKANLRAGSMVRGASTISMQLAKNLFLDRQKTLGRKARETVLTWWLERSLGKRQIMELYVNVIEFGPDLYGLRPASRHYFQVEPHELTPAQSIFLTTLLPSPVKRHRQFEERRLTESTRGEIQYLLRRMHRKGTIATAALELGLWELQRDDFFDRSIPDRVFGPPHPDAGQDQAIVATLDARRARPLQTGPIDSR